MSNLPSFLKAALKEPALCWTWNPISAIADLRVPDLIHLSQFALLQADHNLLLAQWFVHSIVDPESLQSLGSPPDYWVIYNRALQSVQSLAILEAPTDQRDLASAVARLVLGELERRARFEGRNAIGRDLRQELWEAYGPRPRCWICGYLFSEWARLRFLKEPTEPPSLPRFLDYIQPRGLTQRDISVEVDHVLPVARGGAEGDNLRLACGWCNGRKGHRMSLYDVAGAPLTFQHPQQGRTTVPRGFWVVRLLALKNRCEWASGCDRTALDAELRLVPRSKEGALVPTNLRVVCSDHDSLGSKRFVDAELIRQWAGASSAQ